MSTTPPSPQPRETGQGTNVQDAQNDIPQRDPVQSDRSRGVEELSRLLLQGWTMSKFRRVHK